MRKPNQRRIVNTSHDSVRVYFGAKTAVIIANHHRR